MIPAFNLSVRWIPLFLAGALAAVPAAPADTPAAPPARLRVVTSFYPLQIAALNVIGDIPGVSLHTLTPPHTGCLHDYQMTPLDLTALAQADLFIINGGGMEAFLSQAIRQLPHLRILDSGEGLQALPPSPAAGNPHYWVSPALHLRQIARIADGLAAADPSHAQEFHHNASNYAGRVSLLQGEMHTALAGIKQREIITFHEAFAHFALEFGLIIVAVIEPENGSQPSARELAQTIDVVRAKETQALFIEPQYPSQAAQTISRETGVPVFTLDSGATGPVTPDAYLNLMRANLKTLRKALQGESDETKERGEGTPTPKKNDQSSLD
jgi:zinc transport system substrate-binding protein